MVCGVQCVCVCVCVCVFEWSVQDFFKHCSEQRGREGGTSGWNVLYVLL